MTGFQDRSVGPWIMLALAVVLSVALWRLAMAVEAAAPDVFLRASHLAFGLVLTAGALAMVGVALRLERASWRSVGLGAPYRPLAQGALWFLVPAAAGLGVALLAGWGQARLIAPPDQAAVRFVYLILLVFLSEALPEELIFRGYLQSRLTARLGAWGGVLVQALLFTIFAVMIGAARTGLDIGFIASFGVALGVLRAATGSLWATIGFHLAFMTVQQSYGAGWDLVGLTLPETARMLVLTQIPFALVIALLFSRAGRAASA